MPFTFVRLHNLENEIIEVNAYHIMTMQRMPEPRGSHIEPSKKREFTEIRLVDGEVLSVEATPEEVRTLISMNGDDGEGSGL